MGRGIAIALGAEGATVYVTGRTMLPDGTGSLNETVASIEERGGEAFAVRCDHAKDEDVQALFERVGSEQGRCDILINNVFATPQGDLFNTPFWKQPIQVWDTMIDVGLRSHYVASVLAVPWLQKSAAGLIVNISSFGGASYQVNVAYGVGKAGVDRLARDMARDLRDEKICSVSLYPGVVRTEKVLSGELPFSTEVSESPEFAGRVITALALDEQRMKRTGKVHVVAELAREYGVLDIDGTEPQSLREIAEKKRAARKNP
ncbi:MAG: dehydrogenase/reductase SDR family protein 1 [Polyangiales bacterium]